MSSKGMAIISLFIGAFCLAGVDFMRLHSPVEAAYLYFGIILMGVFLMLTIRPKGEPW
jgi:hypothetical protein